MVNQCIKTCQYSVFLIAHEATANQFCMLGGKLVYDVGPGDGSTNHPEIATFVKGVIIMFLLNELVLHNNTRVIEQ
jgi:hypothetical protein